MIITCDTPIKSLLKVEEVEEQVNEYYNLVKTEINELTITIAGEQKKGLSAEAFNIDGDNLLYEKATTISRTLSTILSSVTGWKNETINKAKEKRQEELSKLTEAVYNKLVELSEEQLSLNIKKLVDNNANITSRLEEGKQTYLKYKEKYDKLLSMKE